MVSIQSQYSEENDTDTQTKGTVTKNRGKRRLRLLSVSLLLIAVAGFGVWQYWQNHNLKKQISQLQGDGTATDSEIKELVEKVGKLIKLPDGEDPTIATVTDPEKLSGQAFFATAQTGDKVLIYAGAKKAILYRPSESKIIEVAPINMDTSGNDQSQVAGSITQVKEKNLVPINIQNGSQTAGLAQQVANKLKSQGFAVVSVNDDPTGTNDKTSMGFGEQYRDIAPEINKLLDNQAVADVQIGSSVVTIILGKDFQFKP